MSTKSELLRPAAVVYPESDGRPIADNTLQFEWISTLKWGYEELLREVPDVFVAGDLLWYPLEGDNRTRAAPDVLIAFGRPKGHRGSYLQFREGGVAPQVVFEVLSPGNRPAELIAKFGFYDRFGVQEYYIYDPDRRTLDAWIRETDRLRTVPDTEGFTSPRLGTRFELGGGDLEIVDAQGRRFLSCLEARAARHTAESARDAAESARDTAESARDAAESARDAERVRAERLSAQLRSLGVDPVD